MSIVTCHTVTDERGRELIEHGTALFPVSFCEDFLAREAVPWHWHEEMEAVWVERGTAVAAAGAERFLLRPGECVFVNAGVLHADWQEGGELCVLHSVVFHPRLVGGGMDSVFWHDYLQPLLSDPSLSSLQLDGSEPWRQEALNAALAAFDAGAEEAPVRELASSLPMTIKPQEARWRNTSLYLEAVTPVPLAITTRGYGWELSVISAGYQISYVP